MPIEAVIFDRDNTLLHFDPACMARLEAQIAEVAPAITPKRLYAAWAAWPGPWPRRPNDEPTFWAMFWQWVGAQYEVPPERLPALCAIGGFYHTSFSTFPDTLPCLHALRDAGLRLAVLTNFELPSVGLALQYAGVSPALFQTLLSSTTIGAAKPDTAAYEAAVVALGLPFSACAFVDDLPAHVAAAHRLGMRAFLLDRSRPMSDGAARVLCSLDDLPAALLGISLAAAR